MTGHKKKILYEYESIETENYKLGNKHMELTLIYTIVGFGLSRMVCNRK